MMMRIVVPLVVAAAFVPALPAAAEGLSWQLCSAIAKDWDDQKTECALVRVPLDYANPGGRTIDIAVSRIRATGSRTGSILVNPGGPGLSGMTLPRELAASRAAGLAVHHDLIGFDPRGVDYSANLSCTPDTAEPDPSLSDKEKARFKAGRDAKSNQQCISNDPELVRSITISNVARDMDRIRVALGEEKIGYYGISWGTALGAQYRTLFDDHIDKMLLDSVMAPTLDLPSMDEGQLTAGENTFHDFASWIARYDSVYHFGTTQPCPGRSRPRIHRWDTPRNGANVFQQTTLLCNDSTGPRDFDTVWRDRVARMKRLPMAGGYGTYEARCIGWPIPATPWQFTRGTSPLQLVGHLYEPVTPIGWALAMQRQIGGALMTIEDDAHGSLSRLPCAESAVAFFDSGQTTTTSCAGAPTPTP